MTRRSPLGRGTLAGGSATSPALSRYGRARAGLIAALAVALLAAPPAWARSSYFQGRFGSGGAAMGVDAANATLPAARTNLLPTPTLNDCLVGTGTDWITGSCASGSGMATSAANATSAALGNIALVGGSLTITPTPAATLTTDQAQAIGGSTLLPFVATTGATVGQTVQGASVPLGTQVASIVSTAQITQAANGAFLTGQPVIPMATTAGFAAGQQCTDTTAPSAIGAGNVILSIQSNVSITLTSNTTAGSAGAADSITCDPVVILTTATSAAIGSGAGIKFFTNHTALSAPASLYDPGDASIGGNLIAGGALYVGAGSAITSSGSGGALGSNAFNSTPYLPLAGGTLTGALLFTDNTLDIGASGATRPRTGYFGTNLFAGGYASIGAPSGSPSTGDVNISGAFKVNGVAISTGGGGVTLNTSALIQTVPNDGSTGTTANKLVIYTTANPSAVKTAAVTDTSDIIGICVSGITGTSCGTTGNASIAIAGQAQCVFDGATTAGDFVVVSTTAAGDCHDAGATVPPTVSVFGQVLSTNGGAGTYAVDLSPIGAMAALNSKAKPGGSNTQVQYNASGAFGANASLTASTGAAPQLTLGVNTTTLGALKMFGNTSGDLTLNPAAVAGTASKITFPAGITDFSATGGASQVLKQTSAGGAFTVAQLANTDITGLGTMSTQAASAVAITGGTIAGLTGLAIRDTSAAFDVTLVATSSTTLTGAKTLTIDMVNASSTLKLGTAGTKTFFAGSDTVAGLGTAQSWTAPQRTNTETPGIVTTTYTPVFSTGQNHRIVLPATTTATTIANPAAIVAGQAGMFEIVQGATSASLNPTWGSEYEYPGGTSTIVLTTTLGGVDYIPYYVESTGTFIVLGAIDLKPIH